MTNGCESLAQALGALRPSRKLYATILSPMVVQQREFFALHKVPLMSVRAAFTPQPI